MESDLIPSAEAAELLGISSSTLHRWVESGRLVQVAKLPGIRGARLFRRSDVMALVDPEPEAASA